MIAAYLKEEQAIITVMLIYMSGFLVVVATVLVAMIMTVASLKRGHVISNRCRHPHPRDLTEYIFDVAEVVMFTHSNQIAIPFPFETELRAWINAVYENAVGKGFVRVPWHPDDRTVRRLKAYFHSGLSPAEAVCACFCPTTGCGFFKTGEFVCKPLQAWIFSR